MSDEIKVFLKDGCWFVGKHDGENNKLKDALEIKFFQTGERDKLDLRLLPIGVPLNQGPIDINLDNYLTTMDNEQIKQISEMYWELITTLKTGLIISNKQSKIIQ